MFDSARPPSPDTEQEFPFCVVDHFVSSVSHLTLLSTAFELGLIELLEENDTVTRQELCERLELDPRTHWVLFDGLMGTGVLEEGARGLALTARFRKALEYRDLLMVTLELGMLSSQDVVAELPRLVRDRKGYLERARLFRFFRYVQGDRYGQDELQHTQRWVRAISTLTHYESRILRARHDFTGYRRILDIGGNSGELARQLCSEAPHLEALVVDLPIVCEVGRAMNTGPAADRVRFASQDIRQQPLPRGYDLVVFKSFLHDWTTKMTRTLLEKTFECLPPGGQVMIAEKCPISVGDSRAWRDDLMWFPYYAWRRRPEEYVRILERVGFDPIDVKDDLPRELALVVADRPR